MAIKLIPIEPVKKDETFWLEYSGFRKDTGREYYISPVFSCKAKTLKGAKRAATRILTRKIKEDNIIEPTVASFLITKRERVPNYDGPLPRAYRY